MVKRMSDIIRDSEDGREERRQAITKGHSVAEWEMCEQHRNLKKQKRTFLQSDNFFPPILLW